MTSSSDRYKRATGVTVGVFLVYALLVATHLGEFWPFSIYPMFSRGGHPWTRSVVREVADDSVSWLDVSFDALPGEAYALNESGINQNDLANFVSKSQSWTPNRVAALRSLFGEQLGGRSLLVYRADGTLNDARMVQVRYTPYILLTPDTTAINPVLRGQP